MWSYNNDDCISMRKVLTMITEHMCMYYQNNFNNISKILHQSCINEFYTCLIDKRYKLVGYTQSAQILSIAIAIVIISLLQWKTQAAENIGEFNYLTKLFGRENFGE